MAFMSAVLDWEGDSLKKLTFEWQKAVGDKNI
jgi:hypothetical protein